MVKVSGPKPTISCQDGKLLRRVESGRYDSQIITFRDLENARSIADCVPEATDQMRAGPSGPA